VWFEDDPRVTNVKAASGVYDKAVMNGGVDTRRRHEWSIRI